MGLGEHVPKDGSPFAKWFKRGRPAGADGASTSATPDGEPTTSVRVESGATTQIGLRLPSAHLVAVRGPAELLGVRFALGDDEVTIGRQADCDITVTEQSVSRVHATVRFDSGHWRVVHRSRTNPTLVNGKPVADAVPLYDGDEVWIADAVGFRLDAPGALRSHGGRGESLRAAMEERVELDERIERDFVRDGTFLDVDVVDSFGLKTSEARPENIVLSFERFRELVDRCVESSRGQVLNSNGDEVMAFFAVADDALDAASRLVEALAQFNRAENRLPRPFQVRMGAHTGRSAVDLNRGVAYSPVLDLAGHLQKAAPAGGLLLSDATRAALTREHAIEPSSDSGKAPGPTFVLRMQR